jgi:hypothetical protein
LTESTFALKAILAVFVFTNAPATDAIIALLAKTRVIHSGLMSMISVSGMAFPGSFDRE